MGKIGDAGSRFEAGRARNGETERQPCDALAIITGRESNFNHFFSVHEHRKGFLSRHPSVESLGASHGPVVLPCSTVLRRQPVFHFLWCDRSVGLAKTCLKSLHTRAFRPPCAFLGSDGKLDRAKKNHPFVASTLLTDSGRSRLDARQSLSNTPSLVSHPRKREAASVFSLGIGFRYHTTSHLAPSALSDEEISSSMCQLFSVLTVQKRLLVSRSQANVRRQWLDTFDSIGTLTWVPLLPSGAGTFNCPSEPAPHFLALAILGVDRGARKGHPLRNSFLQQAEVRWDKPVPTVKVRRRPRTN